MAAPHLAAAPALQSHLHPLAGAARSPPDSFTDDLLRISHIRPYSMTMRGKRSDYLAARVYLSRVPDDTRTILCRI